MPRYFEDWTIGEMHTFGERTITEESIISFARRFDPQPIHIDPSAGERSHFGGLIASGWHTASECMRMLVENLADEAWAGAKGVDELRWIEPVQPGDTLSVTVEILDKDGTVGPTEVGQVRMRLTGHNEEGDPVISWIGLSLMRRRPAADPDP